MKNTPNLNLKKPDLSELADIEILNQNADIIDGAIGNKNSLSTSNKVNLVYAINEVLNKANDNATEIKGQRTKAIALHDRLDKIF